jgi:hypothetical protein
MKMFSDLNFYLYICKKLFSSIAPTVFRSENQKFRSEMKIIYRHSSNASGLPRVLDSWLKLLHHSQQRVDCWLVGWLAGWWFTGWLVSRGWLVDCGTCCGACLVIQPYTLCFLMPVLQTMILMKLAMICAALLFINLLLFCIGN